MHVALLFLPGQPPRYGTVDEPAPPGPGEMAVQVLAAGLHPLARAQAAGAHYAHAGTLPRVAGVDGVGRGSDGRLRYFAQGPGRPGTVAERTVVELDHSVVLPDETDPVAIAGALNPAMAGWLAGAALPRAAALGADSARARGHRQRRRHGGADRPPPGRRAGHRAGARRAAAGADAGARRHRHRRPGRRRAPGAAGRRGGDVVLDFVWGDSAVRTLDTLVRRRGAGGPPLTWVHVGPMAGETAAVPGALLRAVNLRIVGSGYGSVPGWAIVEELPALVREVLRGTFRLDVRAVPLAAVEPAWAAPCRGGERIALVP